MQTASCLAVSWQNADLVDLRTATPSSTIGINLGPAPNINNNQFATPTTFDHTMAVGRVHQLNLNGVNNHPFHLHINSYQIVSTPADSHGNYFLAGDWHDVLLSGNNALSVRLQTDRFTGKQVQHYSCQRALISAQ